MPNIHTAPENKINNRNILLLFFIIIYLLSIVPIYAQDRFPRPEFKSDYEIPSLEVPNPTEDIFEFVDLAVLIICLSIVSYLAIKKRSRRGIFWFPVFSLFYFGFVRKGCVCPVGSIQNITLALSDPSYFIPISVIGFFLFPLLYTLFFGRSFCAGVCPLGAIQDLVALKPIRIPHWLNQALSIIPYIYLGLAVLLTATGTGFLICRFDPFVEIFHLGARLEMLIYGAIMLLIGVFVFRPYCRFLCPYGVILGLLSRVSQWHLKITTKECLQCRLCEDACPLGAILPPTPELEITDRSKGIRRLAILLVLSPLIIAGGGFAGSRISIILSKMNSKVRLAEQIQREDMNPDLERSEESLFFRETEKSVTALYEQADNIRNQFYIGGWFFGSFLGLVFIFKLIGLSLKRERSGYEIDKAVCVSCARCIEYCPQEKVSVNMEKGMLKGNE